ncbi:hypothetical protein FB451DRAFT_754772 [Mycena latifolia]|nr:hypothetical protein FB451DRAFT_754772 [Mycena latifolia]
MMCVCSRADSACGECGPGPAAHQGQDGTLRLYSEANAEDLPCVRNPLDPQSADALHCSSYSISLGKTKIPLVSWMKPEAEKQRQNAQEIAPSVRSTSSPIRPQGSTASGAAKLAFQRYSVLTSTTCSSSLTCGALAVHPRPSASTPSWLCVVAARASGRHHSDHATIAFDKDDDNGHGHVEYALCGVLYPGEDALGSERFVERRTLLTTLTLSLSPQR